MMDFRELDLGGKTRAVILGKGPTFEGYRAEGYGGDWIIAGINQVARVTRLDVMIAAHLEPLNECREVLSEIPAILVPYYPLYGWSKSHDKRWDEHEVLRGRENVYAFSTFYHPVPGHEQLEINGTSAHALFQCLALKGVKEFVFYGVDGGMKAYGKKYYADGFTHDSKEYFNQGKLPADFDQFWTFYFQLRRKYGLRLTFA